MKKFRQIAVLMLTFLSAGCQISSYVILPQNFTRWSSMAERTTVNNGEVQTEIRRERIRRCCLPFWPGEVLTENIFVVSCPFEAMLETNGKSCTGHLAEFPMESSDGEKLRPFGFDGECKLSFVHGKGGRLGDWRCDMLVQSPSVEEITLIRGPHGAFVWTGMLDGLAPVYGLSEEELWIPKPHGEGWSRVAIGGNLESCLVHERKKHAWAVIGEKLAITPDGKYLLHGSSYGQEVHVVELKTGFKRIVEPESPENNMFRLAWGFRSCGENVRTVFLWGNEGRLMVTDETGRLLGKCSMPVEQCRTLDANWLLKSGINFLMSGERHLVFGWVGLRGYPDDYGEIVGRGDISPAYGQYPLGFFLWDWEAGIAQLWSVPTSWCESGKGRCEITYRKLWEN